jgi:hypothetical protein
MYFLDDPFRSPMMPISAEIDRFLASNRALPPSNLGKRYDAEKFLPEAGNTVVCHLDFDSPSHSAVLEARRRMQALPGADRFLFTPVSSLHMTVFEGVIDTHRTQNTWPAGFDLSASVESATKEIFECLKTFSPPPDFAVRVAGLRPTGLILEGATAQDEANMRAWREALTVPFGYRHDDHDDYKFHMTFAYPIAWLPDDAQAHWEAEFGLILADFANAAPVIPLVSPAFCQFADMNRFEELLVLSE